MSYNSSTDILVAGAVAAVSVDLLVYPLDTLKTRIQSPNYATVYKDASGATRRALFRGLYQGAGSIIAATIPSSGAFFTTYEFLKDTLDDAFPPNSTIFLPKPAAHALASGGAELVSCAILTPAEVIKQNAQMVNREQMGRKVSPVLHVLGQFKNHPFRLFRGYTSLVARNLPFTALQFPAFEKLKVIFMEQRKQARGGQPVTSIPERAAITAVSGGLAGAAAAWITTPMDVIKTRIMLAAAKPDQQPAPSNKPLGPRWLAEGVGGGSKSASSVAISLLKSEGIQIFFCGAALRAVWTFFGSGLYLGCYEACRFYLEEQRRSDEEDQDPPFREKVDLSKIHVGVGTSRSQGDNIGKSRRQLRDYSNVQIP
ncbi:hypothetical protein DV738_g2870, partial [Chaetothyriales sp. CBS 135597]